LREIVNAIYKDQSKVPGGERFRGPPCRLHHATHLPHREKGKTFETHPKQRAEFYRRSVIS
jgi:hypothetical protein